MDEKTPLKKARPGVNPVNKLPKHVSDQGSEWKAKAQYRRQNRHWLSKSRFIALSVLNALKAQKVSQKELAERMNVSPLQISKIVKGQENLTLETLSNLEIALGIQIIDVTSRSKPLPKTKRPGP